MTTVPRREDAVRDGERIVTAAGEPVDGGTYPGAVERGRPSSWGRPA
ncbi:hypothetical protein ACWCPM_01920 [Streptomyces sp. NPDC002309]